MTKDPDVEFLLAYARGEGRAAQALTNRLLPRVLGHARRLLGDEAEAEDVAQEAMIRLWKIAPEWREGEAKVTTWLFRVTSNLCLDRMRRRRNTDNSDFEAIPDDAPSAEQELQAEARRLALQDGLDRLPFRQRQAVVLRHLEGLGNIEIGRIMDIGPRAVESLTARGKKSLAALLEGRREELGYEDD